MKISPLSPSNAGQPGMNLGSVSTSSNSPERLEVAKRIAAGENNSISVSAPADQDPQVAKIKDSRRKMTMKTKATPLTLEPTIDQVEDVNTISGVVGQAEAAIEDTKPLSPQFAALAKQRRALQVKERELVDREKAISEQPVRNTDEALIAKLKSQPLSVLQEYGVTYDQLTNAILSNQGVNPEIQSLKDEIKALKEGVDKNFVDRDTQQEQAALAEMRKEATFLSAAGEAFEMVRETNSLPEVMDLIYRTYKSSGEVLDVKDALQAVEDELINESLKIANLSKVRAKVTPTPEIPQLQPKQMKTLTNRDTARTSLSAKQRAIQAFHGTLKK